MPDKKILTMDDVFRQIKDSAGSEGKPDVALDGSLLRASFTAEVEPESDDSRVVTFVVATDQRNRNGMRLNPDGWKLENYLANPVVLWAHDQGSMPVGKALEVWVEANKLKAKIEFTPAGMARFNDTLFAMVKAGFLGAVSAGWLPIEWEWVEGPEGDWYLDFIEQELMEISIVPVPAEPRALRIAAAAGIDVTEMRNWARQLLEEPRFVLTVPARVSLEQRKEFAEVFADFYPSSKLMVIEEGMSIVPLDEHTAPVTELTTEELAAISAPASSEVDDIVGDPTDHPSEPSGADEPPAEGISAPDGSDPSAEGAIHASRDWRIRRLSLLS